MSIKTDYPVVHELRSCPSAVPAQPIPRLSSGNPMVFEALLRAARTSSVGSDPALFGMPDAVSCAQKNPAAGLLTQMMMACLQTEVAGEMAFPPISSLRPDGPVKKNPSRRVEVAGKLAAHFESGMSGIGAIGYDPNGGTSYGLFQIASRPGTLDRFLSFLGSREPEWSGRLAAAGPSNTGGTGGEMPRVWKEIAVENPEKFERLQREFIRETHYRPACETLLDESGLDMNGRSDALKEVLWSTSVQHGASGGARIFCEALRELKSEGTPVTDQALIDRVYLGRSRIVENQPESLRAGLIHRYEAEKTMAIRLLKDDPAHA